MQIWGRCRLAISQHCQPQEYLCISVHTVSHRSTCASVYAHGIIISWKQQVIHVYGTVSSDITLLAFKFYHYKNSMLNKTVHLRNGTTISFQISYTCSQIISLCCVKIDFCALIILLTISAKIANPTLLHL